MNLRVLTVVVGLLAAYLFFSHVTVNAVLPYAYLVALAIFAGVAVYKHCDSSTNYRFDNRIFWTDFCATILTVGVVIQLSGKALTA